MKRFALVGRLRDSDNGAIPIEEEDSVIEEIPLITDTESLGFGVGKYIAQLAKLNVYPSTKTLDLLMVATLVTAADNRISRHQFSQDGWTRELDLYVPVSDPVSWAQVAELLQKALGFLSGDRWRIFFRQAPTDALPVPRLPEDAQLPEYEHVALLSGGLDSFIGASDILTQGKKTLFVSHYWDRVTPGYQRACKTALEQQYGNSLFDHLSAYIGFGTDILDGQEGENTLRTRSFLFFSLAVAAASGIPGVLDILVPENGLISLNVPLDPLRLGAHSTRTTHPFYMARWNELLHLVGIGIRLINNYRFKTKGEMLDQAQGKGFLSNHLASSMSCSSPAKFRYQRQQAQHCGYCLPCVIRRASIMRASMTDPTVYFVNDLTARTLDSSAAEGEHVRSFQFALSRLAQNPRIAKFAVHIPGPLTDYSAEEVNQYEAVYRRGMEEVAHLLEDVRTHA